MLWRRMLRRRSVIFSSAVSAGFQLPEHVAQRLTAAAAAYVGAPMRALLSRAAVSAAAFVLTSAAATAAARIALMPSAASTAVAAPTSGGSRNDVQNHECSNKQTERAGQRDSPGWSGGCRTSGEAKPG